jgi:1-acyl-sn-glycerol-3-phosphate acyltransferase
MQRICAFIFKLIGWKIVGSFPNAKQFLVIVAPHTSNWDLIIGLLGRFTIGLKINFLAKNQVFFFPLGSLLRAVGGMPVDRSKTTNKVEQVAALFEQQNELVLAITPEGTRGPVTRWKEGFYHIAHKAGIPLVMLGFDYATKEIRIGPTLSPSGDINKDFPEFLKFFRTIKGKYPKEIPDYQPKN